MPKPTYVANDTPVPEMTLTRLFFEAVDKYGDKTAFEELTSETELTGIGYDEAHRIVKGVAASLAQLGVERGDRAAILSENCSRWALVDYGCLCAGVIDVPIYTTLTAPRSRMCWSTRGPSSCSPPRGSRWRRLVRRRRRALRKS